MKKAKREKIISITGGGVSFSPGKPPLVQREHQIKFRQSRSKKYRKSA